MKFNALIKLILKFGLRRVDYLAKSVYILIGFIVAEIAAITNAGGIQNVVDDFLQHKEVPPIFYWPIKLLAAVLIGGDWLVLISCVCLLVIVVALKIWSRREVPKVKHIFNSHIRTISAILNDFKNETADKISASVLLSIEDSYLSRQERKMLTAQIYFLRGMARVKDPDPTKMFKYLIDAHLHDKNDANIKSRAATSYYHMGDQGTARQLSEEIILGGRLDERAYAIRAAQSQNFDFLEIPGTIASSQIFKVIYASLRRDQTFESIIGLFKNELDTRPIPGEITQNNIDYWVLVGEIALKYGLKIEQFTPLDKSADFSGSPYLDYSQKIFNKIYIRLKNSEFLSVTALGQAIQRYHVLLNYLMSGSPERATDLMQIFKTQFPLVIDVDWFFVDQVAVALLQSGEFPNALEFIQKYKIKESIYHLLLEFMAAKGVDKYQDAETAFLRYVDLLPAINENEVRHCIEYINYAEQKKQLNKNDFVAKILSKPFQSPILKHVIRAYVFRDTSILDDQMAEDLAELRNGYSTLATDFKYLCLILLQSIGDRKTCNHLIEEYHDWKVESLPQSLFIENLMILKERPETLLALLKHVRQDNPHRNYLRAELQMYVVLRNFDEMIAVCNVGMAQFPDDTNYIYFAIVALFSIGKYDELESFLTEGLQKNEFTAQQSMTLATILIARGHDEIGLQIAYKTTVSNYDIPLIKEQYFLLITTQIKTQRKIPKKVENDTSVVVESEGKRHTIDINERTVKSNRQAELLVGNELHDVITFDEAFTSKKISFKIVAILDKYSALSLKISDEAASSPFSGMKMKAITVSDTPDKITKELIEYFGVSGDSLKIRQDQAFRQYNAGEISFSDLVRTVSYSDPLDVLSFLFSRNSDGFVSIPKPMGSSELSLSDKRVVVDLTVIPMLQKLTKNRPELFKEKFVVSQFLVEHLRQEYREALEMPEEQMTMGIDSLGVRTALHSKERKLNRVSYFEDLISWVNQYCQVAYSTDRLQMTFNHPDLWRPDDWYFNYIIDTTFISWNQILLSDDALYYKYFRGRFPMISLECFLERSVVSIPDFEDVLLELTENHYVGTTLTGKFLYKAFKKPHFGGVNIFNNALQSLPFYRHYSPRVIYEVIEFAKLIYSDSIHIQARKQAVQAAFLHAFKGQPIEQLAALKNELLPSVDRIFYLLPNHIASVKDDILTAIRIATIR